MMEVLELTRQDKIRAHVERFPPEHVEEPDARMRDGRLDRRAVIVPHG
jgi:D-arabinose 1-dehydrogenase-like Zn-dependent alcohol dehydrogenase